MIDEDEHGFSPEDFDRLRKEGQELGLQYTGNDPSELHAFISMARAEKGKDHPVPCFGMSYDPTDRRCRICQLRDICADKDDRPRVEVLEHGTLQAIPCDVCKRGSLEVECLDPETREIRDYACTVKGCPNSVSVQCGWEDHGDKVARELVLGEPELEDEPKDKEADKPKDKKQAQTPKKTGKKKKVTVKRGDKKQDEKPADKVLKKKPTTKKKVVVKRQAKPKAISKKTKTKVDGKPVFRYGDQEYTSLSKLVSEITQSNNWSPVKFFGVRPADVSSGDVLEKVWKGETYRVEVL